MIGTLTIKVEVKLPEHYGFVTAKPTVLVYRDVDRGRAENLFRDFKHHNKSLVPHVSAVWRGAPVKL